MRIVDGEMEESILRRSSICECSTSFFEGWAEGTVFTFNNVTGLYQQQEEDKQQQAPLASISKEEKIGDGDGKNVLVRFKQWIEKENGRCRGKSLKSSRKRLKSRFVIDKDKRKGLKPFLNAHANGSLYNWHECDNQDDSQHQQELNTSSSIQRVEVGIQNDSLNQDVDGQNLINYTSTVRLDSRKEDGASFRKVKGVATESHQINEQDQDIYKISEVDQEKANDVDTVARSFISFKELTNLSNSRSAAKRINDTSTVHTEMQQSTSSEKDNQDTGQAGRPSAANIQKVQKVAKQYANQHKSLVCKALTLFDEHKEESDGVDLTSDKETSRELLGGSLLKVYGGCVCVVNPNTMEEAVIISDKGSLKVLKKKIDSSTREIGEQSKTIWSAVMQTSSKQINHKDGLKKLEENTTIGESTRRAPTKSGIDRSKNLKHRFKHRSNVSNSILPNYRALFGKRSFHDPYAPPVKDQQSQSCGLRKRPKKRKQSTFEQEDKIAEESDSESLIRRSEQLPVRIETCATPGQTSGKAGARGSFIVDAASTATKYGKVASAPATISPIPGHTRGPQQEKIVQSPPSSMPNCRTNTTPEDMLTIQTLRANLLKAFENGPRFRKEELSLKNEAAQLQKLAQADECSKNNRRPLEIKPPESARTPLKPEEMFPELNYKNVTSASHNMIRSRDQDATCLLLSSQIPSIKERLEKSQRETFREKDPSKTGNKAQDGVAEMLKVQEKERVFTDANRNISEAGSRQNSPFEGTENYNVKSYGQNPSLLDADKQGSDHRKRFRLLNTASQGEVRPDRERQAVENRWAAFSKEYYQSEGYSFPRENYHSSSNRGHSAPVQGYASEDEQVFLERFSSHDPQLHTCLGQRPAPYHQLAPQSLSSISNDHYHFHHIQPFISREHPNLYSPSPCLNRGRGMSGYPYQLQYRGMESRTVDFYDRCPGRDSSLPSFHHYPPSRALQYSEPPWNNALAIYDSEDDSLRTSDTPHWLTEEEADIIHRIRQSACKNKLDTNLRKSVPLVRTVDPVRSAPSRAESWKAHPPRSAMKASKSALQRPEARLRSQAEQALKRDAAIRIQKSWRSYRTLTSREHKTIFENAATTIQQAWRDFMNRQEQMLAARTFPKSLRGLYSLVKKRRLIRGLFVPDYEKFSKLVGRIQAATAGARVRRRLKSRRLQSMIKEIKEIVLFLVDASKESAPETSPRLVSQLCNQLQQKRLQLDTALNCPGMAAKFLLKRCPATPIV